MLLTQWRGIFIVLMLYGLLALIWSGLRMPETLPVSERRSLAIRDVLGAFRQTVTNRQTMGYALAAGGVLGSLFAFVFSSQQVFTEIYGLGHYFPLAFAAIAIGTAVAGFLNARFVGRVGMRVISHGALVGFVALAGIMLLAAKVQMLPLPLFVTLAALMMFGFGLMFANFTSLAMEPQGHIAGTASSLYGSITTLLAIGIGTTIGQDYDGTLLPFATGFFLCTLASLTVVLVVEKGRLFKPHTRPSYVSNSSRCRPSRRVASVALPLLCDVAQRIIGKLTKGGTAGGPPLLGASDGNGAAAYPPTPAMKRFADNLSRQKGIKLPLGYKTSISICRKFLGEHAPKKANGETAGKLDPKPVSPAQLLYAKKIAQATGLIIPDDAKTNSAAMSAWIDSVLRIVDPGRNEPPNCLDRGTTRRSRGSRGSQAVPAPERDYSAAGYSKAGYRARP